MTITSLIILFWMKLHLSSNTGHRFCSTFQKRIASNVKIACFFLGYVRFALFVTLVRDSLVELEWLTKTFVALAKLYWGTRLGSTC